jgi:hypothetical protein
MFDGPKNFAFALRRVPALRTWLTGVQQTLESMMMMTTTKLLVVLKNPATRMQWLLLQKVGYYLVAHKLSVHLLGLHAVLG